MHQTPPETAGFFVSRRWTSPQSAGINGSMRWLFLALVALVGLATSAAVAGEARRVALVVGNGRYLNADPLANPVNDATDMAGKLRSLGFEVVEGYDLDKRTLERRIGEFSDRLEGAEAGLFFYAGHGLQVDGRNFIVPVDARLDVPAKLKLEAVPMDDVLDLMEQQSPVSLVFLDACRNNPFTRSLSLSAQTRSATAIGAGLAQFASSRGSFIAFSTAPGAVAMDGTGRNSPFTAALLAHLETPGASISDVMIAVRRDVLAATRNFQTPWEQGSLTERFEFVSSGVERPSISAGPVANAPLAVASAVRGDDKATIETLIRERYLKPEPARFGETLGDIFAGRVTTYGTEMALADLAAAKATWFAQWATWKLEAGAIDVMIDGDRASASFPLDYSYAPTAGGAPTVGSVRVSLGLRRTAQGWRIEREN